MHAIRFLLRLFTVLGEGDDHTETNFGRVLRHPGRPYRDGRYCHWGTRPISRHHSLKSVRWAMPGCNTEEEQSLVVSGPHPHDGHRTWPELIRIGAYKAGTNP